MQPPANNVHRLPAPRTDDARRAVQPPTHVNPPGPRPPDQQNRAPRPQPPVASPGSDFRDRDRTHPQRPGQPRPPGLPGTGRNDNRDRDHDSRSPIPAPPRDADRNRHDGDRDRYRPPVGHPPVLHPPIGSRDPDRDRRHWGTYDPRRDWRRFGDRDDWRHRWYHRPYGWAFWDPFYDPFWDGYYYWNGAFYVWQSYPSTTYVYESAADDDVSTAPAEPPPANARSPIFYPPDPPPLGTPPPPRPEAGPGDAPTELIGWVNEPFYAPLSTRLADGDLPSATRALLEDYRGAKLRALAALRAKIASVAGLPPADRKSALQAFARQQSEELKALDDKAETIRLSLFRTGLADAYGGSNQWNDRRTWRLGEQTASLDPATLQHLRFEVVRAAAYYDDGFTPSFRRLLREAAMDLRMSAVAAPQDAASTDEPVSRLIFFSPETARLILPADLPDELAAKFAAYDADKRAIRQELADSLCANDGLSGPARTEANRALVERLTPRLVALEALADEIRSDVAATPGLFQPETTVRIPDDVAMRLRTLMDQRRRLRDSVFAEYQKLSALVAPATLRVVPPKAGEAPAALTVTLTPRIGQSSERIDAMWRELGSFNASWARELKAIESDEDALKSEIARRFASFPGAPAGVTADSAYEICDSQVQDQQTWEIYGDYRESLFEPGLSRRQRRLLYDGAVDSLSLPLPKADWSWVSAK